jgi:hypothetical protein
VYTGRRIWIPGPILGGFVLRKLMHSSFSALILGLCFMTNASAGAITGSYLYTLTGETSMPVCQTTYGGNPWTDNFASTSGGNSIAADPVTFSICDGTPGFLDDGQFSIVNGANTFTGIFSGVLEGASGSGPGGGDVFEGTISITSVSGYYSSVTEQVGTFEVVTGQINTPAFPTGSIDFESTPEPATFVFTGTGLLLLTLSRKFLKPRSEPRE